MFQFFIWKPLDETVSKVHYLFYSITMEVVKNSMAHSLFSFTFISSSLTSTTTEINSSVPNVTSWLCQFHVTISCDIYKTKNK